MLSRPAAGSDKQVRPFVGVTFAGSTTYVDLDLDNAIETGDTEKAAATVRDHMAGAATVLVDGAA